MQSLKKSGILTNFLGAITDSLVKEGYSPADTKHLIAASLMETIEDMAKKPEGGYDLYVIKPVFRFMLAICQEENRILSSDAYLPAIQQRMQQNDIISSYYKSQLEAIEKNTGGNHADQ